MSLRPDFIRPLVVSGPSGTGKSTLLARLFATHPEKFAFSVSHTTRPPRNGEVDGQHYHFVSPDAFAHLLADGAFIEHAQFSGNFYGTTFAAVHSIAGTGRRCLLDIDSQGVRQIKQTALDPVYLFVAPPSLAALRARLAARGTESDASIAARLDAALREIDYAKRPNVHDVVIVNDVLDTAYAAFEQVALGDSAPVHLLPALQD